MTDHEARAMRVYAWSEQLESARESKAARDTYERSCRVGVDVPGDPESRWRHARRRQTLARWAGQRARTFAAASAALDKVADQ